MLTVASVTQCFDLKCTLDVLLSFKYWTYLGSPLTCVISGLNVRSVNQTVTSLNGDTEPYADVFGLVIVAQLVNYMPRGIEKFLPNLKGIFIQNAKLQAIKQSDLKPFPKLKELNLQDNEIEGIPDNLFAYNPELVKIAFDFNPKLKVVSENALDGKKLEEASFQHTGCVNSFAKQPDDLHKLLKEIQHNCLTPQQHKIKLLSEEVFALKEKVKGLQTEIHRKQFALHRRNPKRFRYLRWKFELSSQEHVDIVENTTNL